MTVTWTLRRNSYRTVRLRRTCCSVRHCSIPRARPWDVRRWINEAAYEPAGHDHADREHNHNGGHGADIRAYCLIVEQPLSWDAFHSWLGRVRKGAGEDLLRVKGILNLIGESAPVAIHGVHHIFHPPVQLYAWPDADHRSRIVFITRGIDRFDLEASFCEYVAPRHPTDASMRSSEIAPAGELAGRDVFEESVGDRREAWPRHQMRIGRNRQVTELTGQVREKFHQDGPHRPALNAPAEAV